MCEPHNTTEAYAKLSDDELHRLRRRRGYAQKDSKSSLKTRLPTMDQSGRKREREATEETSSSAKKTPSVAALHTARAADNEIATQHALWWDPTMEDNGGVSSAAHLDGVDAVMSAWAAKPRGEISGKKLATL